MKGDYYRYLAEVAAADKKDGEFNKLKFCCFFSNQIITFVSNRGG